jgi:hypothetical protein
MLLLLHGAAGPWDEVVVAVIAFGVLWVAVKLAGRKPAGDDDDVADEPDVAAEPGPHDDLAEELEDPAHPSIFR